MQQSPAVLAELRLALDPAIEPWHVPHFTPHLTERLLDARQMELVIAGRPLPDLLLSTGAMEGPFKAPHPVTRWTLAAQRFTRALLAFVLAPRIDL